MLWRKRLSLFAKESLGGRRTGCVYDVADKAPAINGEPSHVKLMNLRRRA